MNRSPASVPATIALAFGCIAGVGCGATDSEPPVFEPVASPGMVSLRGIAVRDAETVWVSGTAGSVFRSIDSGATWTSVAPPRTERLDYRDIQLLDGGTALVMSAGSGGRSRVYRTEDDGATWKAILHNRDETKFYNSMAFWDGSRGVLMSDSMDGRPVLMQTDSAGRSWSRIDPEGLPALEEGEAGFAASGTGVATFGDKTGWVATGGAAARVFRTADGGGSWTVATTPLPSGEPSQGIFSIAFRDERRGVAVGGDFRAPEQDSGNAAWTEDGGQTWQLARRPETGLPHRACVQHVGGGRYLAVGRSGGIAWSTDDGKSWSLIDGPAYYTLGFDPESGVGYAAGADGHVARFTVGRVR